MASGTGVVALRYSDGVLLASDCLLSFGSLARYPNIQRIKIMGNVALAASGDYADFQNMSSRLDALQLDDQLQDDYTTLGPNQVFHYLSRVLYEARCNFNPLLNTVLVAGHQNGAPFLGYVDSIGTKFTSEDCQATGMGAHFAMPFLRKRFEENPNMTKAEATEVLEEAMKIMFYRDCRTINRIQIADCTATGVVLSEPRCLQTEWEHKGFEFEATRLITIPGSG
eukprot:NODE_4364_length_799_cov_497.773810_g4206_i0.p1 GENE.NODE_4364_length_799_cov_497.773810_g4206_i0~~NODE_4364_length_799_cov_497.773810_g4206_i0.p1  ORF type:complete len:244 (+),score=68.59 NODE_4364_length_799_cov_497.773810_g4206_i0:58-732(+)